MLDQLLHEILGLGGGKLFVERNDQKVSHTKRANQRDLVWRSGKQMRGFVRSQYFFRVRIKSDDNRCSVCRPSVFCGSRNDCLMAEMHAVEDTNGKKEGTL